MHLSNVRLLPCLFILLFNWSFSQIIDFEGSLPEGTTIFQQYAEQRCGVEFYLGDPALNQHPRLAEVGGTSYFAFQGPNRAEPACGVNTATMFDMPAAGQGVGCRFLTDDGVVIGSGFPDDLNVIYLTPTNMASGDLLDIDGTEAWTIEAMNGATVISTLVLNTSSPNSGDGLATYWEFNLPTAFNRIRFRYTGGGNSIGLAFDNFNPCDVRPDSNYCCPGDNLIENGSFNDGNVGFQSAYTFQPTIAPNSVLPGMYSIVNSGGAATIAGTWNAVDPVSCDAGDPFMVVNGVTGNPQVRLIWRQQVNLDPEREYHFCAYFRNMPQCAFDVLPRVSVTISGQPVVTQVINVINQWDLCSWQLISIPITNPASTTDISIYLDEGGWGDGNDLAVDEISLVEIQQVPLSAVIVNPTPINITATTFELEAIQPTLPDPSCEYIWEVCELDASYNCIPSTHAINPPGWQTYPNPNYFLGYVGSSVVSGPFNGIFDVNRRYRVTYRVECNCLSQRSSSWIYDPHLRVGPPVFQLEEEVLEDASGMQQKNAPSPTLEEVEFEVHPNPAQKEVEIRWNIPYGQGFSLEVTNVRGELMDSMYERNFEEEGQMRKYSLEKLPAGIYLFRLRTADFHAVQKVVKGRLVAPFSRQLDTKMKTPWERPKCGRLHGAFFNLLVDQSPSRSSRYLPYPLLISGSAAARNPSSSMNPICQATSSIQPILSP